MGKISVLNKIIFYCALALFCLMMSFANNIPDNDLWARLIVGNHFWTEFKILTQDFLSYTPTHFWYDHEWGSSVIFSAFFKAYGEIGLVILKAILIFIILSLMLLTIQVRKSKSTTPYNILYYVACFFAMYQIFAPTVRCHLFTFAFFTFWLFALENVRQGNKKWLFYLPFIMILWNNIHGGCVSGLGLLAIYAVGEYLNKKPCKDYILAFVFSCFATFINPYGPGYVKFLMKATTMERPLITEWMGTFSKIYLTEYIKFKIFMLLAFITVISNLIREKFNYQKADKTKIILIIVTAVLAIKHIKHQPFFVITSAIFLYDDFYRMFNLLIDKIRNILKINSEKFIKKFVITKETLVYSVIFFITLMALPAMNKTIIMSNVTYPIYTIEFVQKNKIKGNLFINFHYGSYAAYKLYPDNLIVMDGRYEEVYYDDLLTEMKDFHLARTDNWDSIIKKYKTDVIIIEKKYPAYKKLLAKTEWEEVFGDKKFAVFVPADTVKNSYVYPTNNALYYDETKFISNLSEKISR